MTWQQVLLTARTQPLDPEALAAVVAGWHPGAQVVGVAPLLGGLSTLLDVVELRGAPVAHVVLRRLLPELGHDGPSAAREQAGHEAAVAGAVPAPRVLWADHTGAVLGRPALLLDHLEGRPVVAELARPAAAAAFAVALGQLHAVDPAPHPALPALADLRAHRDVFGGPQDTSGIVDAPRLHTAVARLAPAFRPARGLVHGDLHGGNVLWDGRVVTGVVDWAGASRGVRWWDEAYAVMDTTMAHGRPAGDLLLAALRARDDAPAPDEPTWALWCGVALARALPSPADWIDGYRATGVEVSEEQLAQRYVAEVAAFLDAYG